MIKKLFKALLVVVVVLALVGLVVYNQYQSSLEKIYTENSEKVEFVVEAGMSADQVIEKLAEVELIPEDIINYVKVYFRFANLSAIQEGSYTIPKNLSPKEILEALEEPESTDVWITIPEGLRKDEIAEIFEKEYKGVEGAVFKKKTFLELTNDQEYIATLDIGIEGLSNLEGFLYPDRYSLPKEATEKYIINTMTQTLKDKVGQDLTYETAIIASMVEREGKTDKDRPMIADIIMRRNDEGWLLQIDATLLYYYNDWSHVITSEDKAQDQPYNTYQKIGLPPTPICNPGEAAFKATLNPTPNSYYYYIHDNDGNAYFAETLGEHETNIQKYLTLR